MFAMDIAQLVRAALEESGCDPALLGDLDSHSTIALDLHDLPSIHVSAQDGEVWLWSRLAEHNEAVLAQRAAELLRELMQAPFHPRRPAAVGRQ